jgi:hypothetical protein
MGILYRGEKPLRVSGAYREAPGALPPPPLRQSLWAGPSIHVEGGTTVLKTNTR